jgi:transcriptional regulator with XRE-family HTH domain
MPRITVAPSTQALLQLVEGPAILAKLIRLGRDIVDAVILDAHPEVARWYGYDTPTAFQGCYISQLHDAKDLAQVRRYAVARSLGLPGIPQVYDIRITLPNGTQRWLRKQQVHQIADGVDMYWVARSVPIPAACVTPMPPITLPLSSATLARYLGRGTVADAAQARGSSALPPLAPPQIPGELLSQEGTAPFPPQPLGTLLRHARQDAGLTQREVAHWCTQRLGQPVTPQHLSNLEQGRRRPSLPLLQALATVLGLRPAALLAIPSNPLLQLETAGGSLPGRVSQHALTRVQQAAQQVTHAQQAYREALGAASHAGYSLRQLAAATGLSPSRIRQLIDAASEPPRSPASRGEIPSRRTVYGVSAIGDP